MAAARFLRLFQILSLLPSRGTKLSGCRAHFGTLTLAVLLFAAGHDAQARDHSQVWQWKTVNRRTFRGSFYRLEDSVLVVERDGWEFSVPVAALSRHSLDLARYLRMRAGPTPKAIGPGISGIRAVVTGTPPALPAPIASFDPPRSILAFCESHLGDRVGSGQCAVLAVEALKNAGVPGRSSDWPGEGDYVWGTQVAYIEAGLFGLKGADSLAQVQPGDVVQFHEVRLSGFNHSVDGEYRMNAHHHTAVVEKVDSLHRTMSILHQNWNGREYVQRQTLYLRGMNKGWLRFYRPAFSGSSGT